MNAAARWSTGDALLAIAPAWCGDAPRDATTVPSVSAEAAPFVLAPDRPPGLFLESLRPTPPAGDRLVVYSEPGRADPLTGRVLALTRQDDRNGDLPEGAHAVRISRFGKGRLGRQGGFTWIGWNGTAEEGEDPPYYGVIGKGLRPFADGPMALSDGEVRFGAGTTQRWSSGPGDRVDGANHARRHPGGGARPPHDLWPAGADPGQRRGRDVFLSERPRRNPPPVRASENIV
ncbi:hypothetical protein ACFYTC_06680 [Actinomadura nitritigenes]|uniref:hypothetical protein n=1 Tax=Actinomadura nitritigenes TaxID=134602 RepID=UPI0036B3E8DE